MSKVELPLSARSVPATALASEQNTWTQKFREIENFIPKGFTTGHVSPWSEQDYSSEFTVVDSYFYIWPDKTSPQGFIVYRLFENEAEILNLAVREKGQGQGSLMLEQFIQEMDTAGAKRVFLEVAENNAPALKLYFKHSFKREQVRLGYYRDGQSAWLMSRDLDIGLERL